MKKLDQFIHAMLGDLHDAGRMWARIGLVALVVASLMSFDFGRDVSLKHGIFLAVLSFVAAFGPEVAHKVWGESKKIASVAIALICAPLLMIEFYSHAGYTAGIRGSNVETAGVVNTKYEGAQEAAREDKSNLELWKKQLATLMEQDAWTATVKADALREELGTLKSRIEEEKKGQRGRRAGCGKECERLQDQANAVAEKLGKVEQREDLSKRIEATQRILDKKRDVAANTEHKSSTVVHQNQFLAKSVALIGYQSLNPTPEMIEASQQSASIAMAAVATGLPAFCLFIAGLYRIRGRSDEAVYETTTDVTPASTFTAPTVARDLTPVITNTKVIDRHHRDPRVTDMLHLLAAAGRRSATA